MPKRRRRLFLKLSQATQKRILKLKNIATDSSSIDDASVSSLVSI